jgi:hypothetical protein
MLDNLEMVGVSKPPTPRPPTSAPSAPMCWLQRCPTFRPGPWRSPDTLALRPLGNRRKDARPLTSPEAALLSTRSGCGNPRNTHSAGRIALPGASGALACRHRALSVPKANSAHDKPRHTINFLVTGVIPRRFGGSGHGPDWASCSNRPLHRRQEGKTRNVIGTGGSGPRRCSIWPTSHPGPICQRRTPTGQLRDGARARKPRSEHTSDVFSAAIRSTVLSGRFSQCHRL